MNQSLRHQLASARRRARPLGVPREGRGGHLDESAAAHQLSQPLGHRLERRVALRVSEQQAIALNGEPEEMILEGGWERSVGAFDQQIGPALTERGEAQVVLVGVERPDEVELAGRHNFQLDPRTR